jgi:hypothetical protein
MKTKEKMIVAVSSILFVTAIGLSKDFIIGTTKDIKNVSPAINEPPATWYVPPETPVPVQPQPTQPNRVFVFDGQPQKQETEKNQQRQTTGLPDKFKRY